MINTPDFISFENNYQKSIKSKLIDIERKWNLSDTNSIPVNITLKILKTIVSCLNT